MHRLYCQLTLCFANLYIIAKMPKAVIKRKRLTFEEKYQLLRVVKAGASKQYVLQKYGVSETMYRKLLSRETDLNNKVESYEYQNKKSSRTCSDVRLDAAIFEWFKQARDRGDQVSGPIIQEKARILDEKLNGSQTFKASSGWLYGFKRRYSIRMKGEKSCNDPLGAAEILPVLKTKIESENIKLDNIYNADESGILWRLLTGCTLHLRIEEKEALEREECKDRVTALFCANVSGSHRIPLLLIGKSETPTCLDNLITTNSEDQRFKNLDSLGVLYTHQDNAWMDKSIFLLWYKEVFIPRVLERQRQDAIAGKVVLLLDNAPCHPSLDELNAINENFEVVYLPPIVPASNQPMAQGLIATTKKLYKKELVRRLLFIEESERAVEFLKEFGFPDCFGMLSLAWNSLETTTLQKAWKQLLGDSLLRRSFPRQETDIKQEEDPLFIDDAVLSELESSNDLFTLSDEIFDQVSELLSGPNYSIEKSKEHLFRWLENENDDCGWEPLSDCDIVNFVTSGKREPGSVTKMKNSETMLEDPVFVNCVASGRRKSEILPNSEIILENPVFVSLVTNIGRQSEIVTEIEKRKTVLEDPVFVNFVRNGNRESEIVPKIENSEARLENLDIVNFVTNVRSESEIVPKIKNSETMFRDPVLVSPVKNGIRGSEIGTGIEMNETVLEDPVFDNFVINGKRGSEIEKGKTVLKKPEPMEITSSLEALNYLMKFKNWVKSRRDCLPKHLDYIRELENLTTEHEVCSWT
ncbi:jerky protein homolog-like [Belonocnema kinseyi]|uniref:jerky protein homolog-like n=1 Tax=Belonocnema kinseyi TaxID=2817044 RepID=UPI00143DBD3A|nr:jerky protein homolog-like [Belonocnema kinseyi]